MTTPPDNAAAGTASLDENVLRTVAVASEKDTHNRLVTGR
jgi:hypothetical protein